MKSPFEAFFVISRSDSTVDSDNVVRRQARSASSPQNTNPFEGRLQEQWLKNRRAKSLKELNWMLKLGTMRQEADQFFVTNLLRTMGK